MEKINDIIQMGVLRDKLNEIIELLNKTSSTTVVSGSINLLKDRLDGWYQWKGTIADINGTWMISKASSLYTATNMEDPRIVLNSTNLTNWYSPFGSWHI